MKLSHLSVAVFSAIALAACGGSSDNAVKNSQNGNQGDEPKKEEPKKELPPIIAQQLKGEPTDAWATGIDGDDAVIEIDGKEVKVVTFTDNNNSFTDNTAGTTEADDFAKRAGYVQNSRLLLKNGKTKVGNDAGDEVDEIYAKTSKGTFGKVLTGDPASPAKGMVFAPGTDAETLKDPSKALKADEVYQQVSKTEVDSDQNTGSYLTKISAFGTDYTITDADSAPENLTFDNLEANKVIDGKSVYTVNTQLKQKEAKAGAAGAVTIVDVETPDGTPNLINGAQEVPVNFYKAYKQAYSTVVLATDSKYTKVADAALFQNAKVNKDSLNIIGVDNLGVPTIGSASYNGKAFTAESTGDIRLDVQFGQSKYQTAAEITNRTSNASGDKLTGLVSKPADARNNDAANFTLELKSVDDSVDDGDLEYNKLTGKFYGTNAEEIAGYLHKDSANKALGGFAASK